MAIGDHDLLGRHDGGDGGDGGRVGDHPQAMPAAVRRGGIDVGVPAGGALEHRLGLAARIAIEHEDLGEVRLRGLDELEAIDFGSRQRVLVGQHHAVGKRRQQDQREESLARVALRSRAGVEAEGLLVAVDGRRLVLAQAALGDPGIEHGASVVVLGIVLAARQIEVHDVAFVLRLQHRALLGRDDIVGWGEHPRGVGQSRSIEAKSAKGGDAWHSRRTLVNRWGKSQAGMHLWAGA